MGEAVKVLRVSSRTHKIIEEIARRERRTISAQAEILIDLAAAKIATARKAAPGTTK